MGAVTLATALSVYACTTHESATRYSGGSSSSSGGSSSGSVDGGATPADTGITPGDATTSTVISQFRLAKIPTALTFFRGNFLLRHDLQTGAETVLASDLDTPSDYALDVTGTYWVAERGIVSGTRRLTQWSGGARIATASSDGDPLALASDANGVYSLSLDSLGRTVVRKEGATPLELAATAAATPLGKMRAEANYLYWAAVVANQSYLFRTSTSQASGNGELLATVDATIVDFTTSAAGLYVATRTGLGAAGTVSHMPLAGGTLVSIANASSPRSLVAEADGTGAFYTDLGPYRFSTATVTPLSAPTYSVAHFTASPNALYLVDTTGSLRTENR